MIQQQIVFLQKSYITLHNLLTYLQKSFTMKESIMHRVHMWNIQHV